MIDLYAEDDIESIRQLRAELLADPERCKAFLAELFNKLSAYEGITQSMGPQNTTKLLGIIDLEE